MLDNIRAKHAPAKHKSETFALTFSRKDQVDDPSPVIPVIATKGNMINDNPSMVHTSQK